MVEYLILGAGPSGLAFANKLVQAGIHDFMLLEAEKAAGGLCRSVEVDGSPFDTGGGHFLDVRRPGVNEFLFRFMPKEEWELFERNSQIAVHGQYIHHPFEANIWEFCVEEQIAYLKSIAGAGVNTGAERPEGFIEWITWKLGDKIAEEYMIPYNRKMFGDDLDALGTYWLEKLPDVSFEDTLRSCLERRAYAKQPGHAQFYYPKKHGFGELWHRMAEALGDKIQYGKRVRGIDFDRHAVTAADGTEYEAEKIITTVPWMEFEQMCGIPQDMQDQIRKLKYSSIQTDYYSADPETDAHWIYCPDPGLDYHRILVRKNFCAGSRGYWTETNLARANGHTGSIYSCVNKYAYPLNTVDKPEVMERLLGWCRKRNVYALGRWGEHQHYNSDAAVELAIKLAEDLAG